MDRGKLDTSNIHIHIRGGSRIQDFKLGGTHLKKWRRAEGGAKIFEVFRVKNRDFTRFTIAIKAMYVLKQFVTFGVDDA